MERSRNEGCTSVSSEGCVSSENISVDSPIHHGSPAVHDKNYLHKTESLTGNKDYFSHHRSDIVFDAKHGGQIGHGGDETIDKRESDKNSEELSPKSADHFAGLSELSHLSAFGGYKNHFGSLGAGQISTTSGGFKIPQKVLNSSTLGFDFSSKSVAHYPSHKVIQNGNELQFSCNQCGKCFSHSCKLQNHQRSHNGEKPFKCQECGRGFTQKAGLIQHQRLHTGEKPFRCQECGKCFTQLSGVIQHQRTHSGEKPYSCLACGRAFTQRAGLLQHERTHTGEKPYTCLECGKCFTQLAGLNQHVRTHTGEKPYRCEFCGKCYSQYAGVMSHMKAFHNFQPHSPTQSVDLQVSDESFSDDLVGEGDSGLITPKAESSSQNTPNHVPASSIFSRSVAESISHMANNMPFPNFVSSVQASPISNQSEADAGLFPREAVAQKHKFQNDVSNTNSSTSLHNSAGSGGHFVSNPFNGGSLNQPSPPKRHKIDKPYKCHICGKSYTLQAGLMVHQASHKNDQQQSSLSSAVSAAVESVFMNAGKPGETSNPSRSPVTNSGPRPTLPFGPLGPLPPLHRSPLAGGNIRGGMPRMNHGGLETGGDMSSVNGLGGVPTNDMLAAAASVSSSLLNALP